MQVCQRALVGGLLALQRESALDQQSAGDGVVAAAVVLVVGSANHVGVEREVEIGDERIAGDGLQSGSGGGDHGRIDLALGLCTLKIQPAPQQWLSSLHVAGECASDAWGELEGSSS